MAIWQYDLVAVPRQSLLSVFGELPEQIQPNVFDNHDWWSGVTIPDEQEFSSLLPRANSWSSSITVWGGDNDGHRFELHYDNGKLFELKIRFDLRVLDREFLDAVLEFIDGHDYVLWTEEGVVLEPILSVVLQDIAKSRAFSFVRDPGEFLNRLGRAGHEENQ